MKFNLWLENQKEREDVVGDFAFTILHHGSLPDEKKQRDEHQVWAAWLASHHASWELINAFNAAWKEYQEEAQATS